MKIIATMATYPARAHVLLRSIQSILPQVDELHLVFNQISEMPAELTGYDKITPYFPDEDLKDVGKFYPSFNDEDLVFFTDDDLVYREGYFATLRARGEELGLDNQAFGLHASTYRELPVTDASKRKVYYYRKGLRQARVVDQLATNSAMALGKHIAPFEYMRGSQKFVDVRYGKWCFEQGITQITVPRRLNMAHPLRHGGETIFRSFTQNSPESVLDEINSFAGKNSKIWEPVGNKTSFFSLFFG